MTIHASEKDLYLFEIFCNDCGESYKIWGEVAPTTCSVSKDHTIDVSKTRILEYKPADPFILDTSGKIRVQETPRNLHTITCWTGAGDSNASLSDIGNGEEFIINHKEGDSLIQHMYADLWSMNNPTYLYNGTAVFLNAMMDQVTMEIVTRSPSDMTIHSPGSYTGDYNIVSGLLIPSVPGEGMVTINSDITKFDGGLSYIPDDDNGIPPKNAYWDAEWDGTKFTNIVPNMTGEGRFNLFAGEFPIHRFVNVVPLAGSGSLIFESHDSDRYGHGFRIKITTFTREPDHSWILGAMFTMHRKYTVNH